MTIEVPSKEGGPERRRIAVVLNGNAKSVSAEVISALDQIIEGGDLYVSRRLEEVPGIARSLLDRGYDTILTGGGDGTFTVVVTAVVREAKKRGLPSPRFGLLRLGTGNSLAWVVGSTAPGRGSRLVRALSADVARLRADAGSRMLPLIEAEGLLSPFAGFGIDANVLGDYAATKKKLGSGALARVTPAIATYAAAAVTRTIPGYLFKPTPHCRVVNRGGDALRIGRHGAIVGAPIKKGAVIYEGPATIASMSTIPYYGFGFRMFPYAEDRPGKAQLRVSTISSVSFVRNFPEIWRGEHYDPEMLFDFFVDTVDIEMDPPTAFQVGGDIQGERRHVRLELTDPVPVVDFYSPPSGA
ncbi:MAG TPA: diacylglycerol kinase family protein [Polyangiaceae bacterium]|jgi:diacylglycerol kinase family enzyme|nr:diacylglycerol kinase family protein [Polyangiaceae bacterium]